MERLLLMCIFFLLSSFVFGQEVKKERGKIDTIYAELGEKVYVYFENDIRFVDVGSGKKDFSLNFTANCAFIRAIHSEAQPTSILFDYGDGYYHGTLCYKKKLDNSELVIDFRDKGRDSIPQIINETRAITKKEEEVDKSVVIQRLGIIQGTTKDKFKTIAIIDDHLKYALSDLRRDDEFLYIKLSLENKSRVDYKIQGFSFAYFDEGLGTDETGKVPKYVRLHKFFYPEKVAVKKKEYMTFAIPYFALSKKGNLNITMKEKEGTRVLSLDVQADKIIEAENF
jgi:hypothetical protein